MYLGTANGERRGLSIRRDPGRGREGRENLPGCGALPRLSEAAGGRGQAAAEPPRRGCRSVHTSAGRVPRGDTPSPGAAQREAEGRRQQPLCPAAGVPARLQRAASRTCVQRNLRFLIFCGSLGYFLLAWFQLTHFLIGQDRSCSPFHLLNSLDKFREATGFPSQDAPARRWVAVPQLSSSPFPVCSL